MTGKWKYILGAIAAGSLAGALVTTAFAGSPGPIQNRVRPNVKKTTIPGSLYVGDVLRVQKNVSAYGKLYAHAGEQVWGGLLSHSGGITVEKDGITVQNGGLSVAGGGIQADSLVISGPIRVQDATVSGNLQAGTLQATGAINGQSLAVVAGATVGGTLGVSGKITGSGVDAGTGNITTTGNLSAGAIAATSVSDSGSLTAGDIRGLTANLTNLTVTGNVNFTNATVTGLVGSNLNLGNLSIQTANIGTPSSSAPPLNLSANGHTVQLAVNTGGELTVDNLAVGAGLSTGGNLTVGGNGTIQGALTIAGNGGLTTPLVTAPTSGSGGSAAPGPLMLTGSTISLSGNTQTTGNLTIGGGNNLVMTSSPAAGGTAGHIAAGSDKDLAGTVSVNVTTATNPGSGSFVSDPVTFQTPYPTAPIVTVTPTGDPDPGGDAPKVWVELLQSGGTGPYTGFRIHYALPTIGPASAPGPITFDYHVIGGP